MAPPLSVLKAKGITIEEDPAQITPLPPYAEDLRQLLLNFEGIVPLIKVLSVYSIILPQD